MSHFTPFFLIVDFEDGAPQENKKYTGGASSAVQDFVKAEKYYRTKFEETGRACTLKLKDHRGALLAQFVIPEKNELPSSQ